MPMTMIVGGIGIVGKTAATAGAIGLRIAVIAGMTAVTVGAIGLKPDAIAGGIAMMTVGMTDGGGQITVAGTTRADSTLQAFVAAG
jgi:hypothetical protein